jgi:hypothetical protein
MSLEILARQSLKQFSTIYAEVRQERGDVMGDELEALMWEKITGGGVSPSPASQYKTITANLIPSSLLKKIKVQLPFMPNVINYVGCPGLKQCGGLYVPCGAKCIGGQGSLCLICTKHDAKFGRLADRGMPGTYMGGPKPEISFGTWLSRQTKKTKDENGEEVASPLTIEDINAGIAEAGFTFKIPEEQLIVNARMAQVKRRPGRPGVVKKTVVNEDGSESPAGSSLDGFDHQVILGAESDTSTLSSDEEEKPKKKAAPKKASPKKKPEAEVEEYAAAVTAMVETLDLSKLKKAPKAKAEKSPEKEKLEKAVNDAKKAAKEDEKARAKAAKELAKAEEKLAKAEKAAAKEPKAKEEKSNAPKPKPRAMKAEEPKVEAKVEKEEEEYEDEEIEYDGVKYMLRGDIIYDVDDGSIKGRLSDEGDVELTA